LRLERTLQQAGDRHSVFLGSPRSAIRSGNAASLDVTDREAVDAAIAATKPDVVIHLASLAGADCDVDLSRTQTVNVDAVRWVSEASVKHGVSRVVFASTGAVYGSGYSSPVSESAPINPGTNYASSKVEAEEILRSAASEHPRTQAAILRIFNVYGPAFDDSLISRLLRSTEASPAPLVGLDHFVRDYSEVSAVVSALLLCSTVRLESSSNTFNIGSGVATSTRQLLGLIDQPVHYTVTGDAHSYSCANIEAATSELGFTPSIPGLDIRSFASSATRMDGSL
jgi:UDP-glucose 4-epimerase